jgi:hypothetical protein
MTFFAAPGADSSAFGRAFPFSGEWNGLAINFADDISEAYQVEFSFGDNCDSYDSLCATTRYPPDETIGEFRITAPVDCLPHLAGNAPSGACYQFVEDYSQSGLNGPLEVAFRTNFINLSGQTDGTIYWTFMQGGIATAWGYMQGGSSVPLPPTAPPAPTPPPTEDPCAGCIADGAALCFDVWGCFYRTGPDNTWVDPYAGCNSGPTGDSAGLCDLCFPDSTCSNPDATHNPSAAPPSPTAAPPSPTAAPPSPTSAPPSECPYDTLPDCIAECPVALPIYQDCVDCCLDLCGTDLQQQLWERSGAAAASAGFSRGLLQDQILPTPDSLPKGQFLGLANGWPTGQGGILQTSNATEYFGIEVGNNVRISLPYTGCAAFQFLDTVCGTITFGDIGETYDLSYNSRIDQFAPTAGPSATGNTCYQFLSADVDALENNPQNWDVNGLRFFTLCPQAVYGTYWFSWNYGSVAKMDGFLQRGF